MSTQAPTTPIERIAADILTTTVEGGSGYWSCVSDLERAEDLTVLSVRIHEEAGEYDTDVIQASRDHGIFGFAPSGAYKAAGKVVIYGDIIEAIKRLATEDIKYVGEYAKDVFASIVASPEDADYDAHEADIALQIAVLGEVVYG